MTMEEYLQQERYNDQYNWLVKSKSPYLKQHETNPVNWLEWSPEAFEKARREDKPVLVSIGYSTCHWCHVMAHESFEDEDVANLLNQCFVSIKVDREERPDIDSIYMKVCQALTGHGGWPLNVFLTPDQKPFYAGTYFPRDSRFNLPGFTDVITQLYDQYKENHEKIIGIGEKITGALQEQPQGTGSLSGDILHQCYNQLVQSFDIEYGGFGDEPKFPAPHMLTFLLRYWRWTKKDQALDMVTKTLNAMADGGLYDHIGYGFARYSVDEKWLVPHFEKMLYDNAMLAMVYTEAYQITKNDRFKTVANEIFHYVGRDMLDEDGGFYSAEDADSEGEEGKFYVWGKDEIFHILGDERGKLFCHVYDITEEGNFEGANIPNLIKTDLEQRSEDFGLSPEELITALEQSRKELFQEREKRVHPGKDDKILTFWNGLMTVAFAKAARVFGETSYVKTANNALTFIENRLKSEDRLMARYRHGEVKYKGFIDDYANLLWAYIEMYETTFDTSYLEKASQTAKDMVALFWDDDNGGFYFYGNDAEDLIYRPKELYDGAIPSGNSVAALNLLRLAKLTGQSEFEENVSQLFSAFGNEVTQYPSGYCYFLQSLLMTEMNSKEVVVLGEKTSDAFEQVTLALQGGFLPEVVYLVSGTEGELTSVAPFTKDFTINEENVQIYVCENFACQRPTSDVETVLSILKLK